MVEVSELFSDPRPDLAVDTALWTRLLRLVPQLDAPISTRYELQRRLWTIRSAGTLLRPSTSGLRFVPLIDPDGAWINQSEFDDMKKKHLSPHALHIRTLLNQLEGR